MPEPLEPTRTADAAAGDAHASAASDRDETASASLRPAPAAPTFGPPAAPDEVGTLGPYRVVKQLGAGGMGAVYLALDTRLDRKLALKVMLPEFAADRDSKERFLREAKAAAKVGHDNVVIVHEADEREGVPYIAMQFLQGMPLDAYLRQKGAPGLAHVIRIGRETALGLAAAHALELVHRDIKPANLWLEAPNGRVKVLDFGLAKPIGSDTELTKSGAVVGTPAYMSPEQARGSKVDARTDLFSLGAVLYRLCTGKTPFAGPNVMAVMMALGMEDPTPVRELNPNVPESLAELIHQLLAKKPEQRPQTAAEVAKRLQTILNQLLAPPAPAVASSGSVPAVSAADLSASQPVVVHALPHQPPIVVPMHVSAAPESAFANLDGDANTADATAAESAPAPKPERKKGGKGLLLAVGGAVLLAAVAVAVVLSQMGKKGEPTTEQKPLEAKPGVPAPPKDGGKPSAGSIPVLKPVGNEWVDVLALDEKLASTPPNSGAWVKRNGKWSSGREGTNLVLLPVFATGSYRLVAEVTRDEGGAYFGVVLPVGNNRAVSFGIHDGGALQGFHFLNGFDLEARNPTFTSQPHIPTGRMVKLAITVTLTDDRVELQATVDGGMPIRWAGAAKDVAPGREQPLIPGQFCLASWATQWTAHSLKFQKIDGEAAVLGWGPPGSDPDRKAAEWVLSVGGSVQVNGEEREITVATDLPKGWFALARVKFIFNKAVTDAGLAHLKDCKNLTHLGLTGTGVTDAGLAHLKGCKNLTSLVIGYTDKISDAGLVHLKDCKNLTHLGFDSVFLTGTGLVHFKDCQNLTNLHLYNTQVTDVGLAPFKDCKALTHLNLGYTKVTDAGLAHLKDCKKLTSLLVGSATITDAGLAHFKDCKNLTGIILGGTPVTDAGFAHFKDCKSLTYLDLSNTKVTDAVLAQCKDCENLKHLFVKGTKVTAKGLEEFHAAVPGCQIHHDGGVIEPKK